jgi:hypothetical protein
VSSAYTKRLYAALRRDAQRVATKGLKLMNVETRQVVDWQDADYKLPWADWHVLDGHLQDHSLIGMITIVGPQDKLHAVCQSLQSVPQVTAVPGPGKLQLWVTEATAAAQSRAWKIAAKAVLHGCA